MGLSKFLIIYLSLAMILRIFLIFDNFEPGDSYKKNSYKKKNIVYGNCAFPQNFHTRKSGEVTSFFAEFQIRINVTVNNVTYSSHRLSNILLTVNCLNEFKLISFPSDPINYSKNI